jgi:hypothetical protein
LLVDIQIISGVKLGAAVAALDLGTSWVPLVAGPTASSRAGTRQEECLVASQYITQTPAAYGFPLLIKGLLESGGHTRPGTGDRVCQPESAHLLAVRRASRKARFRSRRLGSRAGRYGGNHGLGYPSVSGVFLRGANTAKGSIPRYSVPERIVFVEALRTGMQRTILSATAAKAS